MQAAGGTSFRRDQGYAILTVTRRSGETTVAIRWTFWMVCVLVVGLAAIPAMLVSEYRVVLSLVVASIAVVFAAAVVLGLRYIGEGAERDDSGREAESLILLRALEVFGDSERASQWLREGNPALGDETPLRALQTEDGREKVRNILGRIEHGVIS